MGEGIRLSVVIGDYPHARLLKARLESRHARLFDFISVAPVTKAFAPMVRQGAYDICEMALITFLQAKALGTNLVLLPVVIAARPQEASLICLAGNRSIQGPADLAGKKIGVRAYSQTTGAWVRGILHDDFGISPSQIAWITFEDAHVAEYTDPPGVTRAGSGRQLLPMLRSGELDAAIVGNDKPNDPVFRDVFPDAEVAGAGFKKKHGFTPVNHVVVARREIVEAESEAVAEFLSAIQTAWADCEAENYFSAQLPLGRTAIDPAISLALKYAGDQDMLVRPLTLDETWEGLPPELSARSVSY